MTYPISQFVDQILRYHIKEENYLLTENESLKLEPAGEQNVSSTLLLLNKSIESTDNVGFSEEWVRKLACCAYQAIKNLKNHPSVTKELLELSLKNLIGQKSHSSPFKGIFLDLIMKNHLHYKMNRYGLEQPYTPSLLVEGRWISCDDIKIVEETDEIQFSHQGNLLFKTDKKHQLKEAFFCGMHGIVIGNISSTYGIEKGTEQFQGDGKYYVRKMSDLISTHTPYFKGDHSYMGLIDNNGVATSYGQYGMQENLTYSDYLTPTAPKRVGVESPDRYQGLPYTNYHHQEIRNEITKESYEQLKTQAIQKIQSEVKGCIGQDNCTGFVKNELKSVNIHVDTSKNVSTFIFEWFIGSCLPKSWSKKIIELTKGLPVFLFPPLYAINVILGLIYSVTSFEYEKGWRNLFQFKYLIKALFAPWLFTINHPHALNKLETES